MSDKPVVERRNETLSYAFDVLLIIASLYLVFLSGLHSYRSYKKRTEYRYRKKRDRFIGCVHNITVLNVATVLSIVCGYLYVFALVMEAPIFHEMQGPCGYVVRGFSTCWYLWHKCFLYETLILRLQLSFLGSVHEYSQIFFRILHGINLFSLFVCGPIVCIYFSKVVSIDVTAHNDKWTTHCKTDIPFMAIICAGLLDMAMNSTLTYLFIRPLQTLSKEEYARSHMSHLPRMTSTDHLAPPPSTPQALERNDSISVVSVHVNNEPKSPPGSSRVTSHSNLPTPHHLPGTNLNRSPDDFLRLVVRTSCLASLMVTSTLICFALYVCLQTLTPAILDVCVNGTCLLLMFSTYERVFSLFCGRCASVLLRRMDTSLEQKMTVSHVAVVSMSAPTLVIHSHANPKT